MLNKVVEVSNTIFKRDDYEWVYGKDLGFYRF